jgi:hypothetical protein
MNEKASKLSETRSRLYRRRFLQPSAQFAALCENCTIYVVLHRSDINILEKHGHQISANEKMKLMKFCDFAYILQFFHEILMNICRNFAELCRKCHEFLRSFAEICEVKG